MTIEFSSIITSGGDNNSNKNNNNKDDQSNDDDDDYCSADLILQEEGDIEPVVDTTTTTKKKDTNNNKDNTRSIQNVQQQQQQQRSTTSSTRQRALLLLQNVKMPNLFDTELKRRAWMVLGFVVVILGAVLLGVSLRRVESTEYGLQYNNRKKILDDAAKTGGLYVGPPGYRFIKFPSTFISVDVAGTCLSMDGLRVQYSVSFQYQMSENWLVPAVKKYRDFHKWSDVVEASGGSAVQHSCSEFTISNFQNQRGQIQSKMLDNLRINLEGTEGDGESGGVYALAISLQLKNVEIPDEYQNAVSDKQRAEEDISLAQNQRKQETTKATTELLSAQEEARKIIDTATIDAELIQTEATLQAEETMYEFTTEATTIAYAKQSLNLTTDGVIAYTSNQLYAMTPNLAIQTAEPASISRSLNIQGNT